MNLLSACIRLKERKRIKYANNCRYVSFLVICVILFKKKKTKHTLDSYIRYISEVKRKKLADYTIFSHTLIIIMIEYIIYIIYI